VVAHGAGVATRAHALRATVRTLLSCVAVQTEVPATAAATSAAVRPVNAAAMSVRVEAED
jgi:hypothetical protein